MHPRTSVAADKATAPYGSWASPITAAAASVAGRTVEGLAVAGDARLVWVEKRPDEGGYVKPSTHTHSFFFLFYHDEILERVVIFRQGLGSREGGGGR